MAEILDDLSKVVSADRLDRDAGILLDRRELLLPRCA